MPSGVPGRSGPVQEEAVDGMGRSPSVKVTLVPRKNRTVLSSSVLYYRSLAEDREHVL